jgi:hypothetical protein
MTSAGERGEVSDELGPAVARGRAAAGAEEESVAWPTAVAAMTGVARQLPVEEEESG